MIQKYSKNENIFFHINDVIQLTGTLNQVKKITPDILNLNTWLLKDLWCIILK